MATEYEFEVAEQLGKGFTDYAKELDGAACIRLTGYLLGLANAVQQHADISADVMWHAKKCTSLFNDVDKDDPMEPGYHLHNMFENMADDFDELADLMIADRMDIARERALAKLTDEEKELLGVIG